MAGAPYGSHTVSYWAAQASMSLLELENRAVGFSTLPRQDKAPSGIMSGVSHVRTRPMLTLAWTDPQAAQESMKYEVSNFDIRGIAA